MLHDYSRDTEEWKDEEKKGKNNINDKNIDICINDKKIKFNYKYKSNEKGNIQVKFVFKKLLTSTTYMFYYCSSLQSINLSSFNITNVKDMSDMFSGCSSLQSIDFKEEQLANIDDISLTLVVLNEDKSIDSKEEHILNMARILLTLFELNEDKSIEFKDEQLSNI